MHNVSPQLPRVAVFCSNFLHYSQTFIHNELLSRVRYETDVFAWRRLHEKRFPYPRVYIGNLAYAYARRFRIPLVVTFHGYYVAVLRNPWRFSPQYWPCAWWGPAMLQDITLGLCASNDLRNMLIDLGVPADKLIVYKLGIEVSSFMKAERDWQAIAHRLHALVKDPISRQNMAEAGRLKMEKEYNNVDRLEALETLYDTAIAT